VGRERKEDGEGKEGTGRERKRGAEGKCKTANVK